MQSGRLAGQLPLSAFPVPARGSVQVRGATPAAALLLFGALGRRINLTPAPVAADGSATIVLPAALAAGVYQLRSGRQTLHLTVE